MLPELDADVICVQEGAATLHRIHWQLQYWECCCSRPTLCYCACVLACMCAANMEWIEEMTDNEYVQQNYFASDVNGRTFNGSLLSIHNRRRQSTLTIDLTSSGTAW